MFTGHSADEVENLSNSTGVRAPSSSGQHAIDAWESEGGGLRGNGRDLGRTELGDNAGWRASNNAGWRANHPHKGTPKDGATRALTSTLADDDEEDRILRFLGAAVILRWSTIPRKLQRELFDNASSMGELQQAAALKGRIARFLHKHKHDAD
jgi:hypothetical protein